MHAMSSASAAACFYSHVLQASCCTANVKAAVGGLLSTHLLLDHKASADLKYDGSLLRLAEDLADRLLPAFDTLSGIPLSWVNLKQVRQLSSIDTQVVLKPYLSEHIVSRLNRQGYRWFCISVGGVACYMHYSVSQELRLSFTLLHGLHDLADRQVSAKIPADEVKRNLGMCRVCCPKRPGSHVQLVLVP